MSNQNFFLKRIAIKSGPPIHLIWFVTQICNLKCEHCFCDSAGLSEQKELNTEEMLQVIEQMPPLLSLSLTGGEPFLRNDLPELVRRIDQRKITPNLLLFSNGFNTDHTVQTVERVLAETTDLRVFAGVSLDGDATDHDRYRKMSGSYDRAVQTIRELKKIADRNPRFSIGVNTTLHGGNQDVIDRISDDIQTQLGVPHGITIIRGDVRTGGLKEVRTDVVRAAVEKMERDRQVCGSKSLLQTIIEARQVLGQRLSYQSFLSGKRSYDCYAGSLLGVIYAAGDVYPCEMLPEARMGNLRDFGYDLKRLWAAPRAEQIRQQIKTRGCCCTYECQFTCNTLYNPRFLPFFAGRAAQWLAKKIFGG